MTAPFERSHVGAPTIALAGSKQFPECKENFLFHAKRISFERECASNAPTRSNGHCS